MVQLCFGLFPLAVKGVYAGGALGPEALAAWRITVGALALGLAALVVHGRAALPPKADLLRLFACAQLGVSLNQGLYLEGVARSTAVNAGIFVCLIPVFTYGLAIAARQERFQLLPIAGIAVALFGTLPLYLGRGAALVGEHAVGNLLMTANAFSYSVYLVLSKPLLRRIPPLVLIAWVYLLSLPAVPWFARHGELLPQGPETARATWSLAYVLVFATVLAYLLNTFALARVRSSTTAFFIYLQPLIAGSGGVLLLGEPLTPGTGIAALCFFAGTALVLRRGA